MDQQEQQAPTGLDDYFARDNAADAPVDSGQQSTAEAPAAEAQTGDQISAPTSDRPRDEAGRFAKAGVQPEGAPPAPNEKDPAEGLRSAAKAEREKRQRVEAELVELRRQIAGMQRPVAPQPPAPQAAKPSPQFWDDPEGFITNLKAEMGQQVQREVLETRLSVSESGARARYADYQQMEDVFAQLCDREPALRAKLAQHPDPAEFAYQTAKHVVQLHRMREDPASALDDAAFEKAAAARGYTKAPPAASPPPPVSLPKGLADARSTRSAPSAPQGARPLSAILGR